MIHLKIGNLKMKDFHDFISKNWKNIQLMSLEHKLVNVFLDRTEGVK